MRGLLDVSVFEVRRLGSGPDGKGSNRPRRPNTYIKQTHVRISHKKYHGLSILTESFPRGISMNSGIVSARNWDGTILTWSDLDNVSHNSCENNNVPVCILHAENGFLGA